MSDIKKEIESMAVAAIACPSCEAPLGRRCRNSRADDQGRHRYVKTHQRRLSKFVAENMHTRAHIGVAEEEK